MAYDRYDTRDSSRGDRSRWSEDRDRHERGFFERAGDEVASWFGGDDAERRRREDRMRDEREQRGSGGFSSSNRSYDRGYGRDWERDRSFAGQSDERGFHDRGWERSGGRGYATSERDYNPEWKQEFGSSRNYEHDQGPDRDRGYRPVTGDYSRGSRQSERFVAGGGPDRGFGDYERSQSPYGRDEYRRTSRGGTSDWSDRSRHEDPHYHSWRQRHMTELDRDYDDYRREHQSKFENDFTSWREKRQQKRGLLSQIREHMEVIGNDDRRIGEVDRVAGDRIILTKSDPESGGAHHSLSCSDIGRVEGDRVILDCSAEEAKQRWRDESRSRALFEREDQGEMGPRMLDRSFEGTYR